LNFFNIGKANSRIAELEKEIAELKAAKPADDSAGKLADALASNETISEELTQAKADLATANAALETAQGEVNAAGTALKSACSSLKLKLKDGATSAEMITALQDSVASTLAKLNVPPSAIPAAKPAATASEAAGKGKTELKGRDRMIASMKIEGITDRN
jgi:chromosome segregation ATPase